MNKYTYIVMIVFTMVLSVLKLAGLIICPWWLVTLPVWLPLIPVMVMLMIIGFGVLMLSLAVIIATTIKKE